ncbi:hypothetical protein J14TS2_27180 [Bacillus sp. J14TS2]|uniref:hypothetical protein n=1 Tax=Bacillus sp. J14TS2 TaxID=2807188 RepID=UPI001B03D061|nr:hypothetical protein [Bacillus sp. J14TS2]GIN72243.1 hypothetical protein J14TS2_27180 [Bacillus sp. J14TS2]
MDRRQKQSDYGMIEAVGVVLVLALILFISRWLSSQEDKGQFIKFIVYDVLVVNMYGILLVLLGLALIVFCIYFIVKRKAANPKRLAWIGPLLAVFLIGLGGLLSHNLKNNLIDITSYVTGNTVTEEVVIEKFAIRSAGEHTYYEYIFADGREFSEKYSGKGFRQIEEGRAYVLHYLPKSKKLLNIKLVE